MIPKQDLRILNRRLIITLLLSVLYFSASPGLVSAQFQSGILFHPQFFVPESDLIIQNLESNQALVALSIYDDIGIDIYTSPTLELPPSIPKKIKSEDLVGVPSGIYSLVTSADRNTKSLIVTHRPNANGDNLAFYKGESDQRDTHWLAPIYRDVDEVYSSVFVQNASSGSIDIDIQFYDLGGLLLDTLSKDSVPPNAFTTFNTSDSTLIPSGYIGWAKVAATGAVVTLAEYSGPNIYEYSMPIDMGSTTARRQELLNHTSLPRLFKADDDGAGSCTSQLVLVNPGEVEATLAITYTNSENSAFYAPLITLPPKEMRLVDLADESYLAGNEIYSAIITSSTPIGINEVTYYDTSTPLPTATYQYPPANEQKLPRLIQQDGNFSVFSIQNTGANTATGSVEYVSLDGTSAGQTDFTIPAGGFIRLNTLEISLLSSGFEGGAIISSTEPIAVQVDEYIVTPNPVPSITSLSPNIVKAGSPSINLTVNGTNFLQESEIQWNGSPITTTYKSASQLQASVPASNLINPQTVAITVKNPPPGGGISNTKNLTITEQTFVYLPLSILSWPPETLTPLLDPIYNGDQDNKYTVSWKNPSIGATYILEEAWDAEFTNAGTVYQGTGMNWTVPMNGKLPRTYYYRVKAKSRYGESVWSTSQSVTIYPLYVGLKGRWDGKGFIYWGDYYEPGSHETFHCDALTDTDTIRCQFTQWYDPDPIGFGTESWNNYYSVVTGAFKSSDLIDDPVWKWGYSWKLGYNSWFNNGDTVKISGQEFTVTGPHDGYTTYGQPIRYWQFVNQDRFLLQDLGDDVLTYVHAGEATLRYDAGSSGLLIFDDVNRHAYYQGEDVGYYAHYIENLTAATSLPGSPPVPMTTSDIPLLGQPTSSETDSAEEGLRVGLPLY